MKVVVLAGGEGTRLRPLTLTRPKPMIPIGPNPPLHHLLVHLASEGFTEVVIVVGYLRSQIMGYVGDGSRFGLKVSYVVEPDNVFFGTAGSLKLAEHLLDETFLVTQADTITEIPLANMVRFHEQNDAMATLALTKVTDPSLYGVVVLDEGSRVVKFQEKPKREEALSSLISTGFYVCDPDILDFVTDVRWDFGQDLFPHLMNLGKKISGFTTTAFWVDVGGLNGFLKGARWVLNNLVRDPPGWINLRDYGQGPILIGKGVSVSDRATIEGPSLIESGVTIEDAATIKPYTIVKMNSSVGAGANLDGSLILESVQIGKNCSIRSSIVGETASLGREVTIEGSIIGPGSNINDRATVETGSRIWPNVQIGVGEKVTGVVAVPRDKAFYFYQGLGQYTGTLASSVDEFIIALNHVPQESIVFHIERRDIEKWAREVLASDLLADVIGQIRKTEVQSDVREALINSLTKWREEAVRSNGESSKGERKIKPYVSRHL